MRKAGLIHSLSLMAVIGCSATVSSAQQRTDTLTLPTDTAATEPDIKGRKSVVEKLTYQQQPGLAMAASKIFFSEKRWSVSGFGELNYVHYLGDKSIASGDMELYHTHLYRLATFFGYRITDKIVWNSEFQVELLHDGLKDHDYEIIFEAFMDFMPYRFLKARVGFFPLLIGYVNNNDEPVMFYSVNRSEVERIITPSTWVELGVMAYGNITKTLSYGVALTPGLHTNEFIGSTWIRQGRVINFKVPSTWAINAQVNFTGIKNTTLSMSTYHGTSGQGRSVEMDGQTVHVTAPVGLYSGYARWARKNITAVAVGSLGTLGETHLIHRLTEEETGTAQLLGTRTYGALAEVGVDIVPYIRGKREVRHRKSFLFDTHEMKLPLFVRYERLDTHWGRDKGLEAGHLTRNNLHVLTSGINFNLRENIVLKLNYQYRQNRARTLLNPDPDVVEMGFGVIF